MTVCIYPEVPREKEGVPLGGGVLADVRRWRTRNRPSRFVGLPMVDVEGRRVPVAARRSARLLGLAFLERGVAGAGLLIPGCRSVHTFGMRFALDLVFLDFNLRPIGYRRSVPAGRIVSERCAQAVLELPAEGGAGR
jgi:uncharacterized protein